MSKHINPILTLASAFAALQDPASDEEVAVFKYVDSSSDEETAPAVSESSLGKPIKPLEIRSDLLQFSQIVPNDDNIVFGDSYIIVGLKVNDRIIVKGEYSLTVQRGAISVDDCIYHASSQPTVITASICRSIPVIQPFQVQDRALVQDDVNEENKHLFDSDYKAVIKLNNVNSHLSSIGELYPPLKNILKEEDLTSEWSCIFQSYSFELVLEDNAVSGCFGTTIPKSWKSTVPDLLRDMSIPEHETKVLVFGGKNCGKSTFVRYLTNQFLSQRDNVVPAYIMDVDPGQPEYSLPDSISLSQHEEPIFAHNFPFTNKHLCQHYVGFNTPSRQPSRYLKLCESLYGYYRKNLQEHNYPLIINTPGWIKGFGVEVLKALCDLVKPTHFVFVSNMQKDSTSEILDALSMEKLYNINGVYGVPSRYSPQQLRNLQTLLYFHHVGSKFNFQPLLASPPLQVSYADNTVSLLGIACSTVLDTYNFPQEHLCNTLETTVCGIYGISLDQFEVLVQEGKVSATKGCLNLVSSDHFAEVDGTFFGLALIHSVDQKKHTVNLYTPINPQRLKEASDSHRLILVRGRTDIPSHELVPKALLTSLQERFQVKKHRLKIPFVSFEKSAGKGGKVIKIRRNIMRRSQQ